jgi:hypothetical protein
VAGKFLKGAGLREKGATLGQKVVGAGYAQVSHGHGQKVFASALGCLGDQRVGVDRALAVPKEIVLSLGTQPMCAHDSLSDPSLRPGGCRRSRSLHSLKRALCSYMQCRTPSASCLRHSMPAPVAVQVCGRPDVWGDGITPVECAHLTGARRPHGFS